MTGVDIAGPEGARPVLLLHGAAVNRRMWEPHAERLRARYRVVAPDLPGHGARSTESFRLEPAAEEAARVARDLPGGRPLVVGDSLGGYVGMLLAARHPEIPAGLILAGCSRSYLGFTAALLRAYASLAGGLIRLLGEPRLRSLAERELRKAYPAASVEPVIAGGLRVRSRVEALAELAGRDFMKPMGEFSGPVLVVNGEKDRLSRSGEQALLAAAPGSRIRVVPGAGHGVSLLEPEAFTAIIEEFAGTLDR